LVPPAGAFDESVAIPHVNMKELTTDRSCIRQEAACRTQFDSFSRPWF
jgi:hypothetical protein